MGLIPIRLMNAPTNHVPANSQHVHTAISNDKRPRQSYLCIKGDLVFAHCGVEFKAILQDHILIVYLIKFRHLSP